MTDTMEAAWAKVKELGRLLVTLVVLLVTVQAFIVLAVWAWLGMGWLQYGVAATSLGFAGRGFVVAAFSSIALTSLLRAYHVSVQNGWLASFGILRLLARPFRRKPAPQMPKSQEVNH